MKYSDQQRIEKMRETTEKLLRYVEKENITPEKIFAEEAVQWTVTTPLYNIGEHAANLSEDFKKQYACCPESSAESEPSDSLTEADWRRFQRAVSHITISQDTEVTLIFTDKKATGKDE